MKSRTQTTTHRALELMICWADTVLEVRQLDPTLKPGRAFTVGEEPRCDLWMLLPGRPERPLLELASVASESATLRLPNEVELHIDKDDVRRWTQRGGETTRTDLLLSDDWTAAFSIGSIRFWVQPVTVKPLQLPPRPRERGLLGTLGASLALHLMLLFAIFMVPLQPAAISAQSLDEPNRFVAYLVTPFDDDELDRFASSSSAGSRRPAPLSPEERARQIDAARELLTRQALVELFRPGHGSPRARPEAELWLYPQRHGRGLRWVEPRPGISAWLGHPRAPIGGPTASRLHQLIEPRRLPPPTAGAPTSRTDPLEALGAYARLDPALLGADRDAVDVSLLALTPYLATPAHPSLAVQIVIDRSEAMSGERWTSARSAARAIVDRLEPSDRVGLVSYADSASVDVPRRMVRDQMELYEILDELVVSGREDLFEVRDLLLRQWPRPSSDEVALVVLIRNRAEERRSSHTP
jgi:hypothetical protein